jgi:hypothetical protein
MKIINLLMILLVNIKLSNIAKKINFFSIIKNKFIFGIFPEILFYVLYDTKFNVTLVALQNFGDYINK